MRFEPRLTPPDEARPLLRRIGWLALYWAAGVLVLTVIAGLIRLVV